MADLDLNGLRKIASDVLEMKENLKEKVDAIRMSITDGNMEEAFSRMKRMHGHIEGLRTVEKKVMTEVAEISKWQAQQRKMVKTLKKSNASLSREKEKIKKEMADMSFEAAKDYLDDLDDFDVQEAHSIREQEGAAEKTEEEGGDEKTEEEGGAEKTEEEGGDEKTEEEGQENKEGEVDDEDGHMDVA